MSVNLGFSYQTTLFPILVMPSYLACHLSCNMRTDRDIILQQRCGGDLRGELRDMTVFSGQIIDPEEGL